MSDLHAFLKGFGNCSMRVGAGVAVTAGLGALAGILVTGLATGGILGFGEGLPLLIAPIGASAVLLFALPASPLAQPWPILGGNLTSALVGVTAVSLVPHPVAAGALAVGVAIAAMLALRCLHPPGGAVALTAVLGGPAVQELGYQFALWPVALNSLLLVVVALLVNPLAGRRYPHRPAGPAPAGHRTSDPAPSARSGILASDVDFALADSRQLLDVAPADLSRIVQQVQDRAWQRRHGPVTCGDVMSRDLVTVAPDASLQEALSLLRAHRFRALPVAGSDRRLAGILTQTDLLNALSADDEGAAPDAGAGRDRRIGLPVRSAMTASPRTAAVATPITDLVPLMADAGFHQLPVTSDDGRLVGLVGGADLIAALFRAPPEPAARPIAPERGEAMPGTGRQAAGD